MKTNSQHQKQYVEYRKAYHHQNSNLHLTREMAWHIQSLTSTNNLFSGSPAMVLDWSVHIINGES